MEAKSGKGKKKKGGDRKNKEKSGGASGKNGKGPKKSTRSSKKSAGKSRFGMDIFNEEMMDNAYYTCHNIMDVLKYRGFPWPEIQKKKNKKKR
ncbi:small lysine-rich protein 1 [Athalia rosae]|uniref:small lysine-rich protein 1 n=1 Tax=Athalia rosae TaxID=37344 RepID=UPI0006259185|nr:small lysine-rich protein 1 [Athalia rosae]